MTKFYQLLQFMTLVNRRPTNRSPLFKIPSCGKRLL